MNKVKNVPNIVKSYFEHEFPITQGFTYEFYTYMTQKSGGEKIYACNVFQNGNFYHNATQARISWYESNYQAKHAHTEVFLNIAC